MVLCHVKRGEDEGKQFLIEVPASTPCDELTRLLADVHNLRLKVGRLTAAAEGLAQHGPMKPPEQQGLDDATPLLEDVTDDNSVSTRQAARGLHYCQDPTERRTGNGARAGSARAPRCAARRPSCAHACPRTRDPARHSRSTGARDGGDHHAHDRGRRAPGRQGADRDEAAEHAQGAA